MHCDSKIIYMSKEYFPILTGREVSGIIWKPTMMKKYDICLTLLIRVRIKTYHWEKPKVLLACYRLTTTWGQHCVKEFHLFYIIKGFLIMSFSFLLTVTINMSHSLSNATAHQLRNATLLLEALAGPQMVGTARFSCFHPGVLSSAALSCPDRGSAHGRGCCHCCSNQILGHSLHHQ